MPLYCFSAQFSMDCPNARGLKLPRFRGHRTICVGGAGARVWTSDQKESPALPRGIYVTCGRARRNQDRARPWPLTIFRSLLPALPRDWPRVLRAGNAWCAR